MKIEIRSEDFHGQTEHDLKKEFRFTVKSALPLNNLINKKPAIMNRALHAATDACVALTY
jgi:hypothetical protein